MSDPSYERREARRPLEEAGHGEAEGFEATEAELIDHAGHGDQHAASRVLQAAPTRPEDPRAAPSGEADAERSSERDRDSGKSPSGPSAPRGRDTEGTAQHKRRESLTRSAISNMLLSVFVIGATVGCLSFAIMAGAVAFVLRSATIPRNALTGGRRRPGDRTASRRAAALPRPRARRASAGTSPAVPQRCRYHRRRPPSPAPAQPAHSSPARRQREQAAHACSIPG